MSVSARSRPAFLLALALASIFAFGLAANVQPKKSDETVCRAPSTPTGSSQLASGNCTCTAYGEFDELRVDCTHRNFTSIPINSHLPRKTSYLDLRMNQIHRLAKLEKNDDIKHLSLSTNNLTELDKFAFEQTKNLVYLDLSHNHLTSLEYTMFYTLDTLQYLNLSYNKLEFLPKDLFTKCEHLFELRLAHNPLKSISADTFYNLQQLEILDLAENEIFSLESGIFNSMVKLDTLDLSGNEFEAVPVNALRSVRKLTTLDLSGNPIRVINEASFYKLHPLKELRMSNMKYLVEVKRKAFSSLFNLERLTMDHNPHLSVIDPLAFVGTFNHSWIAIRHVSLRRNSLSTLSEATLPFCNLTELDLSENPWTCDCHLHWIKYCEAQKKNHQKGVLCVNPLKLRGHDLESVDHKSMVCENTSSIQQSSVLFSVSLFFMFLMFGTLAIFIYRDRLAGYYGSNRKQGSIYYVRAQSENE